MIRLYHVKANLEIHRTEHEGALSGDILTRVRNTSLEFKTLNYPEAPKLLERLKLNRQSKNHVERERATQVFRMLNLVPILQEKDEYSKSKLNLHRKDFRYELSISIEAEDVEDSE